MVERYGLIAFYWELKYIYMKTKLLKIARRFLPRIFLRETIFDNHIIWVPRWGYTKKEIEDSERWADEMCEYFNGDKNALREEGEIKP